MDVQNAKGQSASAASRPRRVLVVYGTRPEAIKMAPLIQALRSQTDVHVKTAVTGQHRDMLDGVNQVFGLVPDFDMGVFSPGQSLNELSARVITGTDATLAQWTPDVVVIQGDTTTACMVAIASFMRRVQVVHLEAGLRSHDILSPFPEEANRKLAAQVSALHLAPTERARANLVGEGIHPEGVVVTGNTVIDALLQATRKSVVFSDPRVAEAVESGRPLIVLTMHRRENLGEPMGRVAEAVARLAREYPEARLIFPVHSNPQILATFAPVLHGLNNVVLTKPLDYLEFVHLQRAATLIMTDSGGVQEEAPSLGTPVLVLRDTTERPEAIEWGTARLVGTDGASLYEEASRLLDDQVAYESMARASNPYGDGQAARRAVAAILELLGVGRRLPDFAPTRAEAPGDPLV